MGRAVSEIFGRERERASLDKVLDGLPRSGAAALVLEGDVGIGKTTLFEAARRSRCS